MSDNDGSSGSGKPQRVTSMTKPYCTEHAVVVSIVVFISYPLPYSFVFFSSSSAFLMWHRALLHEFFILHFFFDLCDSYDEVHVLYLCIHFFQ